MNKEYNGSSKNANQYYSNVECYGSGGAYRPIIPPTPVTVQPLNFNLLRPYKMPNFKSNKDYNHKCNMYQSKS